MLPYLLADYCSFLGFPLFIRNVDCGRLDRGQNDRVVESADRALALSPNNQNAQKYTVSTESKFSRRSCRCGLKFVSREKLISCWK